MRTRSVQWPLVGCLSSAILAFGAASAESIQLDSKVASGPPPGWKGQGAVVVLIPGTFSENTGAGWASPGNSTYEALRLKTDATLKTFTWSGKNDPAARETAALELIKWAQDGKIGPTIPLYVVAHSHGGNVALLAAKYGLHIEGLTLLCTPVHTEYLPISHSKLGTDRLNNIGFVHQVYAEGDLIQHNANAPVPGNLDMTRSGQSGSRLPSLVNGDNIDYVQLEQRVSGHQPAVFEPGRGGIEKHTDCHSAEVLNLLIATNSLKGMPFAAGDHADGASEGAGSCEKLRKRAIDRSRAEWPDVAGARKAFEEKLHAMSEGSPASAPTERKSGQSDPRSDPAKPAGTKKPVRDPATMSCEELREYMGEK